MNGVGLIGMGCMLGAMYALSRGEGKVAMALFAVSVLAAGLYGGGE